MTTTVTIEAHHASNKRVSVAITDNGIPVEEFTLNDGETAQRHVYDGREISVKEVLVEQIHDPSA